MKKSRSVSFSIFSMRWPVWWTRMRFSSARTLRISFAWMSISVADPWTPPNGWWIMIRAWGSANRLPLAPAASSSAPLPHANGRDRGRHVLHRGVDGHAGRHRAPRRVDVQVDVLVGVLGLEEQHLRDHQVREVVLDERRQKDDPLPQQSREDVERALTARRLLHDHRNQCQRASPCHASTFRRYSCVVDQEIERTLLLEDAATPRHTGADKRELRPGLRTELSVERASCWRRGHSR